MAARKERNEGYFECFDMEKVTGSLAGTSAAVLAGAVALSSYLF